MCIDRVATTSPDIIQVEREWRGPAMPAILEPDRQARIACGDCAAMVFARSRASASGSAATRVARPRRTASSPDTVRPVYMSSRATSGRTRRSSVCEALMSLWRDQAWPLAAMGHNEWTLLAEMASATAPRKRVFPGEVTVERTMEALTLRRSPLPPHSEDTRG